MNGAALIVGAVITLFVALGIFSLILYLLPILGVIEPNSWNHPSFTLPSIFAASYTGLATGNFVITRSLGSGFGLPGLVFMAIPFLMIIVIGFSLFGPIITEAIIGVTVGILAANYVPVSRFFHASDS